MRNRSLSGRITQPRPEKSMRHFIEDKIICVAIFSMTGLPISHAIIGLSIWPLRPLGCFAES